MWLTSCLFRAGVKSPPAITMTTMAMVRWYTPFTFLDSSSPCGSASIALQWDLLLQRLGRSHCFDPGMANVTPRFDPIAVMPSFSTHPLPWRNWYLYTTWYRSGPHHHNLSTATTYPSSHSPTDGRYTPRGIIQSCSYEREGLYPYSRNLNFWAYS